MSSRRPAKSRRCVTPQLGGPELASCHQPPSVHFVFSPLNAGGTVGFPKKCRDFDFEMTSSNKPQTRNFFLSWELRCKMNVC
jgi:hypothetical protein